MQTFLQCPYSPRVQSHASTAVSMLKIQNTGSHTIVWTHENAAPLIGIDSAALATAVLLPSLSRKGQWNTDEKKKKSISNYIHSLRGIIGNSRLLSEVVWTIKAVRL